ncbi:MAG TPA: glycosyltransferase family 2 protein [Thermodesulfovibrionales bacterium]|nr:glycosyltransferase family 2 protein [Thermodesulfovibrionales bacterium]
MNTNIDFLIQTLNEEKNLPYALESCSFADQVFVLDAGSSDRTRQIAERSGAIFEHHEWEGFARQKNWGLCNLPIKAEWVFILDADEAITPLLRHELIAIASGKVSTKNAGYHVNRYFVWGGKRIRHCGYYPSWNLRFIRHGRARYEDRDVHEHMVVDGPVGYLENEMRHEDRRGRDYLWQKHLKYAELEAREMVKTVLGQSTGGLRPSFLGNTLERRRAIKERIWPYLPGRWLFRFFYMYIMKRGFLDGNAGLDMCLFMARYEMEITRKYRYLIKESAVA